jgi:hypothetical protein
MLLRRVLPGVASLSIAVAMFTAATPATASPLLTYCWTVTRTAPIYSTAGGPFQVGTAQGGDRFENIDELVKGAWRYGDDEQNGTYGWIGDGNLSDGVPCE